MSISTISLLKKSDIPKLVQIAIKTYEETYPRLYRPDELIEIFSQSKFEKDLIASDCLIAIAKHKNKLLGYAKAVINKKDNEMLIDKLYVLNVAQGKHLGMKLMIACYQFGIKNHIENAKVLIFDTNLKVKKFYEKFGFSDTDQKIPSYYNGKFEGYEHIMICNNMTYFLDFINN